MSSRDRHGTDEQLVGAINAARAHMHAFIDAVAQAVILALFEVRSGKSRPPAVRAKSLVGVAAAAERLSISEAALRSLVAQQLVPCIRLPSTRGSRPIMRFDLNDLDRYLDELKRQGG